MWQGLNEDGSPDPAINNKKRKNREPLLDHLLLARFAQDLEKARAAHRAHAARAAVPPGDLAPAGPDIPALAQAAGFGSWSPKLLPDRAMILAPQKGSKGDKGVPVTYANARAAPWYDADERGKHDPQGETKAPSTHLLEQYGTVASENEDPGGSLDGRCAAHYAITRRL